MSRQGLQPATRSDQFLLSCRSAWIGLVLAFAGSVAIAQDRDDLVIADFEGETYGSWTTTGTAFGPGPARGTLPGQMDVSGFQGSRLVNSFHGGDSSTGTLTSPSFIIKRPFLNFLIGGGKYPGKTSLELVVDGSEVRSATGPNDAPGGSERLDWASWDVAEFVGKPAVLRIVDQHQGGWGHINVDQIVQSHRKQGIAPVCRELVVNARYLHLPVQRDAPVRKLKIVAGDQTVREFDIRLAEKRVDFLVFDDVQTLRGKTLTFETLLPHDAKSLEKIVQADELPDAKSLYREADRPQFHFTSRRGWLNDPNGLLWHEGEYHLFYQHNPYGWDWGNMHWGHAVSPDLLHWKELPIALSPQKYGDWCFSGSGVVDRKNSSGFGSETAPPLVAAYTSTGRGECIIYSNDRGRTWTEFAQNPVVTHQGRDPRLLFHEPTKRWVMAVYDEADGKQAIAFHTSADLKEWTFESRIDGFYECPDLFELPVTGADDQSRWVLYGADGAYMLGRFDGHRFTPDSAKLRTWYGDFYAAQTFSDTPDRRRVQVGWGRDVSFPAMPFNQQMAIPSELTLRTTDEGIRMFARPVAELASLHSKHHAWRDLGSAELGRDLFAALTGELLEIKAEAEVGPTSKLTLLVRGVPVVYDASKNTLSCGKHSAPLAPNKGLVQLQILVDRGSIEVFGNEGRVAISLGVIPAKGVQTLSASTEGEKTRIQLLEVDELASTWR
ncbi:GH32 C-terminal domain-containing protein [Singulisphaera acidiphila]|uniref:Beta-fructosidase, levanase/invertase n=1 Tax=Singulisphaera acidiphila (strain ATCC BAA-1392 / DSM 18658 / VKM B-2454 / MOB10) TaxID=886293 RepID=L0DIX8_SINAD|nr:GH32 C-terminal domain-containing protein [Singulisphaera acidiphila]AGA28800.1 beta-fructosidase, levanase/invertase [Singulisphaera acidiphila DSM 18658]